MRLIIAALLLSPEAALACSMVAWPPNLGLPGASAGADAVFTSATPGSVLLGPGDIEIAVTRTPYFIAGDRGEVLTPVEPLPPGDYRIEPCDFGVECRVTVTEGEGDPGVSPEAPTLEFEPIRISTGRWANCGPTVPGTEVRAASAAPVVVFAAEPVDTLDDAALLGIAPFEERHGPRWITAHEGDVYAAAVDAEGELSEWTGPHSLDPGCSTTGRGPVGLGALIAAAAAVRRQRR